MAHFPRGGWGQPTVGLTEQPLLSQAYSVVRSSTLKTTFEATKAIFWMDKKKKANWWFSPLCSAAQLVKPLRSNREEETTVKTCTITLRLIFFYKCKWMSGPLNQDLFNLWPQPEINPTRCQQTCSQPWIRPLFRCLQVPVCSFWWLFSKVQCLSVVWCRAACFSTAGTAACCIWTQGKCTNKPENRRK